MYLEHFKSRPHGHGDGLGQAIRPRPPLTGGPTSDRDYMILQGTAFKFVGVTSLLHLRPWHWQSRSVSILLLTSLVVMQTRTRIRLDDPSHHSE
jgi:hypothetical protein